METKLKGKGVVSCSGANVIFSGVHEMERVREGVAVLLNDEWHSAVVNSGVLALEFSELNSGFQGLKFMWWWGTSPREKMVKKET